MGRKIISQLGVMSTPVAERISDRRRVKVGRVDQIYLAAPDVIPENLDHQHQRAIALLRSGRVRVTTPDAALSGLDF